MVVLFLGIALICSSFTPFIVLAAPPASGWGSSKDCVLNKTSGEVRCCWRERVPGQILGVEYCQTCERTAKGWECKQKERQSMLAPPTTGEDIFPEDTGVLEQPPTPPQSLPPTVGENILQQDLGILEEAPSQGVPPLKQGEGVLPELGFLEQQPADQGVAEPPATEATQPAAVEEELGPSCPEGQVLDEESGLCVLEDCPEGQVLDEESGLCVLEEPEAIEEPEEQPTEEEESGSEDNSD